MTEQQLFDFPLHSVMTFDTFIPCHGNASAVHFAQKIADPADPEKLLYIHGPAGSGKTHLLTAVCEKIGRDTGRLVVQQSCSRFAPDNDNIITDYAHSPALLLDDLDLLPDSGELRGAIWETFNNFYAAGRPIMITGSSPPRELGSVDNHLISRLLWGLVACTDASDDTSRRMILKKTADDRNVRIPDDVVDYLLVTTSREVGHLVEAFEQLYRYSLMHKRKINLGLARHLRDTIAGGGAL